MCNVYLIFNFTILELNLKGKIHNFLSPVCISPEYVTYSTSFFFLSKKYIGFFVGTLGSIQSYVEFTISAVV